MSVGFLKHFNISLKVWNSDLKKILKLIITLPIKKKKKSYANTRVVYLKYIWEFFGNSYTTRSLGIMLEV